MIAAPPGEETRAKLDSRSSLQATLRAVGTAEHCQCFMCGSSNPLGPSLEFRAVHAGSVVAEFALSEVYAGYPGVLHGGMTSALLDAAMTNALFSIGVVAVTAELTVRFLAPVAPTRSAVVRGSVVSVDDNPLYLVRAELEQDSKLMARASAKFLSRDFRRR